MSEKVIKYAFYLAPRCKPNCEALPLPSVSLVSLCVLRASVRRRLEQGHSWDPVEGGGSRGDAAAERETQQDVGQGVPCAAGSP